MNDYKELIEQLNGACIVKAVMKDMTKADLFARAADAIEQLVKERDAAVADLKESAVESAVCDYCKWLVDYDCTDLKHETCHGEHWEWRGVQKEEEDGKC